MKALVCYEKAPGCMELRDVSDPRPGPDELLVQVAFCGICGSDVKLYQGYHPHAIPPVVPGHEYSGVVASVGSAVTTLTIGDHITGKGAYPPAGVVVGDSENTGLVRGTRSRGLHMDGAFARYVVVKERFAVKLPDSVSLEAAALTEPLCVAINAVLSKARVMPGHRVLVAGPGTIGLLVAQLAQLQGADVMVTGLSRDENRIELARKLGAAVVINVQKEDLAPAITRFSDGRGVDIAFECVGAAASVNDCLSALAPRGQYVQVGTFGFGKQADVNLNQVIFKELAMAGVFGSIFNDWRRAVQLMAESKVALEALISHRFPLSRWQEAFKVAELRSGLKVLIYPEE